MTSILSGDVSGYGGGGQTTGSVTSITKLVQQAYGHPAGSGDMQRRGELAYAEKLRRLAEGQHLLERNEALAYRAFEATSPSGVGLPVSFNPDPKLAKIEKAAQAVAQAVRTTQSAKRQKKLLKKELALEAKAQRREQKVAAQTQFRVAELYGPNAGYWRERGAPPPLFLLQKGH